MTTNSPFRIFSAVALPLSLLTFALPAAAGPRNCNDAVTTHEMNFCAERDFKVADKKLNAAYRNAMSHTYERDLDKPYDAKSWKSALRTSQRAWIAHRDADCKNLVAREWSGGTGTTVASLGCMTTKTLQRTKELRERYED